MKKTILISTGVVLIAIIGLIIYNKTTKKSDFSQLETRVQRGNFEILVTVTGELQAERSQQIMGPSELRTSRSFRFGQIKIQDLIPEGTVVDSGDYVATLDRTDATNRLKDIQDELEKSQSDLTRTRLDTTMELRNLRDQLINLNYDMEESKITLDQSIYESPAVIRQAQIKLDKATRALDQAKKNYKLKVKQSDADMREAEINLGKDQRSLDDMNKIIRKFEIHAPSAGMVIYKKEFGGQKRTVGSMISAWDLSVATLPDLSSMVSKTYVNEIDISKVKVGQKVRVGVDAFPEKKFIGEVADVANIGEQLPNTDAKVFEVTIKLNSTDPVLRPAMTTSNEIITATYESVLYVPLEAIQVEDSIPLVFFKNGTKHVVLLGESNENEVIIEKGLDEGEKVLLSIPDEPANYKLKGEEIIPIIKERELQKKAEEEKRKAEAEKAAMTRKRNARINSSGRIKFNSNQTNTKTPSGGNMNREKPESTSK